MTSIDEVPKEVLDCADSLMVLNSANPTAEERRSILLWRRTALELFAQFLIRKEISTITTNSSSSTIMESEIIHKSKVPKTDKLKAPLVESNCKIGRCFDVGTKERMPFWLDRFMRDNNGIGPKMIIQKNITATDINPNHGRFSMPVNSIKDMSFLTEDEETMIEEHFNKDRDDGVDATIVDCELHRWEVNLRKWSMTNNNYTYNLVTGWNKVVEEIGLEEKEEVRLWSFHSNGKLYFALVLLPIASDSGKSKSGKRSSALVIHDKPNGHLPRK